MQTEVLLFSQEKKSKENVLLFLSEEKRESREGIQQNERFSHEAKGGGRDDLLRFSISRTCLQFNGSASVASEEDVQKTFSHEEQEEEGKRRRCTLYS